MPSTIDKNVQSKKYSSLASGDIEQGIRVLKDMIGHIRRPVNLQEEEYSLIALAALPYEDQFIERTLKAAKELYVDIGRLTESDVANLVAWIYPWKLSKSKLFNRKKLIGLRHLHLLVLLARITAPLYKFKIIQELDSLGLCPDRDNCFIFLNWLPFFWASNKMRKISNMYIDLTLKAWYGSASRPNMRFNSAIIDEFLNWPANRQILELLAWNICWQRSLKEYSKGSVPLNPTLSVATTEYQLSRVGVFGQLKRKGGVIIKSIVNKLNYKDYVESKSFPTKAILSSILIIAVSISLIYFKYMSIKNTHTLNSKNIDQLISESREKLNALYEEFNRIEVIQSASNDNIENLN